MRGFEISRLAYTDDTEEFDSFSPIIGGYDPELGKPPIFSDNNDLVDGMSLSDLQDCKLLDQISTLILETLQSAQRGPDMTSNKELLLPRDLTKHLARDIACMSSNEPCGARGCALDLIIEDGNLCTRVGKCQVDPLTVTTFEITVVLQRDVPRWFPKLQMMLSRNGSRNESRTAVKPTYKLVKRKLYRKESHVHIQEGS